jgi:hypothetical protein
VKARLWPRCVCCPRPRAVMPSIMRWRRGETVVGFVMGRSCPLSEVYNTSILKGGGSPSRYQLPLRRLPALQNGRPAQRLSRRRFSARVRLARRSAAGWTEQ